FSSRRRHTRFSRDWSSDVCSSDLGTHADAPLHVRDGWPASDALPLDAFVGPCVVIDVPGVPEEIGPERLATHAAEAGLSLDGVKIGRASGRERGWGGGGGGWGIEM